MSETQINWAREIADEKRRDRIRDLERELAAMTINAQWYKDEWEKMRKAYAHECDPKLFDRLAAMTAERDALVQTSGTLCPHCGWRGLRGDAGECAFCQNAKLSADLYNMTVELELAGRRLAEEMKWGHRFCTPDNCVSSGTDCPAREQAVKEGGK